jgi:hypothetical protein
MPIQEANIKLLKSQVMDDVDEGGGRATGTAIADGASNAIFNDIAELDRAYGRVNLRKTFVKVDTTSTDGYYGVHVVVSDPPDDPKVSCALFTTQDGFDTRNDASGRVESYLAQGSIYAGLLFGDHIAGQQTVAILQREGQPLPVNGDTFMLRKFEGQANSAEQYVRVTDVSSRTRTFTDEQGDFKRVEVTLTISDPLEVDFPGFAATKTDSNTNYTGKTKFYTTIVADAARYYGATPLAVAANTGEVIVKGTSIFTQIVPSTRIEIPLTDSRMNQQSAALVKAGDPLTQSITLAFSSTQSMFIGGGILPGSLSISRGGITLTDKGGVLLSGTDQVGTVDYENGICTLVTSVWGAGAGAHTVIYTPASAPTLVTSSIGIPVAQQNQRLNWVVTIDPVPTKKSLQISYRAFGRWYVMSEDGSGAIRGSDSSFGAGALNYQSGSVSLTLGALPDVGSQIILSYASSAAVQSIADVSKELFTDLDRFSKVANLARTLSGDCTFTWNDGTARTATVNNGVISGDAVGECSAFGQVRFSPNVLPAKGTVVTVTTTSATQATSNLVLTPSGGNLTGTAGVTLPGTFEMGVGLLVPVRQFPGVDQIILKWVRVYDDGAGLLKMASPTAGATTVGVIAYSTGNFSITSTMSYSMRQPVFNVKTILLTAINGPEKAITKVEQTGFAQRTNDCAVVTSGIPQLTDPLPAWAWWTLKGDTEVSIRRNAVLTTSSQSTFVIDELFLPKATDGFKLGNLTYRYDKGTSTYRRSINPATGQGVSAGQRAARGTTLFGTLITEWEVSPPTPSNLTGTSAPDPTGADGLLIAESVTFRTAVSPIASGGFTVSGKWSDGATFTATSDANGDIKTATSGARGVVGKVNYETGIVTLRFGQLGGTVGDGFTQNLDYMGVPGVANVIATGVRADSLRYSAVGYSYIPLDANILGLNPVRLPSDGRVPIFRKGGLALIHHTKKSNALTVTNGQTVNLARVRLARVRVIGNDSNTITSGYTVNLDAGTVTFTNVSGYSQPVKIEDRIEDLALIQDAQINGQLTLTRQLTHDFPIGSYVSSALIIGDMKARVPVLFDQATWTGNAWADAVNGSAATATYNDVLAPIAVTNSGAITERWVVRFTNTNAFEIIGEHVGVIATGNTSTDCAPTNLAAGAPYFTIPAIGWGSGWAAGNILRFNTIGALFPVWIIRTIQQGQATALDDAFTVLILGDIDKP